MKKYATFIIGLAFLFSGNLRAQDIPGKWDLESCIQYALDHNIQVRKSKIELEQSQVDTKTAKAQLFPSLSASVSQGFVNYPSSDVSGNNSYSGNYSVNANWKLFDGNKRVNTLKQQKIQDEVQQLNIEESEDDIEIAITQTYMQVLYAYESIRISENTLEVSGQQLDRARQLQEAGSISISDVAQLESQYSSDKYQLVVAQTNLDNYKLQLKQLLELDILEEMDVVIPQLSDESVLIPLPNKETVYNTSLAVMPQIKSSQLNISIAELEKKKAKAGYLPSLSLNAGIGTGHLSGSDYTFGSQIWNKFNESIGLTLSIPIFSNRENKSAVQKAQLSIQASQLELLNSQKALLKTVEGIYLDATSSQDKYSAAVEQVKAQEESFRLVSEQFTLGMKNTVELLTEQNNLKNARQEALQSKYMAILNIQLLNFYQNKPISI